MAPIQATTSGASALSLAVVVAVIYLAVVRFMDLNEKEPLWAVGLLFFLGAIAAATLPLLVSPVVLQLSILWGAVAEEAAKFVAFALGAVALAAVARHRGWSEINGLMDGVVYGSALGFGFATGDTFVRELVFGGTLEAALNIGPFATLWTAVLSGLSDGLYGGIIGAGFGAAVGARSAAQRIGYPIVGLVLAILVHAAYTLLARGGALDGSVALARTWIALTIPLLLVVAVVVFALMRERRAIREELAEERETGAVTEEELAVLKSFVARRSRYIRRFISGDFDGWLALKELHNRQVQLALTKRRAAGKSDPEDRAESEAEVERLRAAVLQMKHEPEIPHALRVQERQVREMNRSCSNCGAEVPAGSTFCPNCGTEVSQEMPRQAVQQSQQSAAPGSVPTAQRSAPSGVQQPFYASPQAPPPGGGSHKGLILGGLAAAAVLGFMVLIVVGALIYFFAIRPGPGPQEPVSQPKSEQSKADQPKADQRGALQGGSLESVIQQQVGDFRLQQIEPIPEVTQAGAADARQMLYVSPNRVEIVHVLAAWGSPSEAQQAAQGTAEFFAEQGLQPQGEFADGNGMVLTGGGVEVAVWSNDVLLGVIEAPEGQGADFYNQLPY